MASAAENDSFAAALLPRWLLDEAIDWISSNMEPEDVFDNNQLDSWAEDSGYVKGGT
jgi:hypothetical protein